MDSHNVYSTSACRMWLYWQQGCLRHNSQHCPSDETEVATTRVHMELMTSRLQCFFSYVIRFLDFFWKLPQNRTSNFRKVVRQHVGSIIWVFVGNLLLLPAVKEFWNSETPLRIDVIAMCLVYNFFGSQSMNSHRVYFHWVGSKSYFC